MRYLLDTNACIDFARGRSRALLDRMIAQPAGALAMSSITYAELAVGARDSAVADDAEKLAALIRIVAVAAFDQAAGLRYGEIVRSIGLRRHSFDRLIAAHALALGTTLVTNNPRDFADVAGLRVENWTA